MFPLQNYKLGTKEVYGWKQVHIYIYYYGEVYQDVNESFCIIRSSFFVSLTTDNTDSFETDLFGFYFYVTL